MIDKATINVLILSFGFMLVFVSFQTMGNILITILTSVKNDYPDYKGDAMIGLCIVYVVFALANFLAPSVVSVLGTKISMILGALTYITYIASFLIPITWVLYVVSALLGLGAAIIWTGQGTYLVQNSNTMTMSRNAGMFWAIFQCSLFFGNLFVFFVFQDKPSIDQYTRSVVYITLSVVGMLGVLLLLFLRRVTNEEGADMGGSAMKAFERAISLLAEGRMLLLFVTFWYTGAILSFAGSIYGPTIGFTLKIAEHPKAVVGLSGVFFGLGEVLGGVSFSILGKKNVDRKNLVTGGGIIFLVCFALIFINLPNAAKNGDTNDVSILNPPSAVLALLCSFLLGFGDSCFQTQSYAIIGALYADNSAPPFALFKFVQSVATGLGFIYTKYISLHVLLMFLAVLTVASIISFIVVESMEKPSSGDQQTETGLTTPTTSVEDVQPKVD